MDYARIQREWVNRRREAAVDRLERSKCNLLSQIFLGILTLFLLAIFWGPPK